MKDSEIKKAWKTNGQGHKEAMKRGDQCVVLKCSEEDALHLSRNFIKNVFAIPTCTHYNGDTLSLYCGDSGREWLMTLNSAQNLIIEHLEKKLGLLEKVD